MTTPETSTYWISIGRNVPGKGPMSGPDWATFQRDVRAEVVYAGHGEAITEVNGFSSYDGVPEETYLLLATIATARIESVRNGLADIGWIYQQDAIGFVGGLGTDTLIPSVSAADQA